MKKFFSILMIVVMAFTVTCLPLPASGSENLNINNISVGDYIYLGNNNARGYTGKPYWKVLNVDKKNKTALVLSEYLWMGDGNDAEARPVFNDSTYDGNTWKGSNVQQWCQSFYEDVLGSSSLIKKTKKTDDVYRSDEDLKYGSCSIDDHVFLLSAAEAETYLKKNYRKAYRHNGITQEWDSSTWWLRSPFLGYYSCSDDNDNEESGFVFGGTGAIFGGFVDNKCCMRPAFNLDLSKGISASRNEYDQWIIDGYNTEDQFTKYENKGGYVGLKAINDSESWIEIYIYRLTGTNGMVKAYFDSANTAYFDDEESELSGEITISGNKLTLDLNEVKNFYFDTDLSDFIGGLHQEYYTSQESKGNELDFSKDVWRFKNYSDTFSHASVISASDIDALLKNCTEGDKQVINEKLHYYNFWEGGSGGHCYGFAATTILNKMNKINICNIAHSTSVRSSEKTGSVCSMICRYQLTQHLNGPTIAAIEFKSLSTKEQLKQIAKKADAVKNGGNPFILSYGADGWGSHAVVGYALEWGSFKSEVTNKTYNRRVLVYDSNYPNWNADACLLFNDGTDEWEVPAYAKKGLESTNDKAYLKRCMDNLDMINGTYFLGYDYTLMTVNGKHNYIFYNNDAKLEIDPVSGRVYGNTDIISYADDGYVVGEKNAVGTLNVVVPNKNKTCVIKPEEESDGSVMVSIRYKDKYVSIYSEESDAATFSPEGQISVAGNSGDMIMTVVTDKKGTGEVSRYSIEGNTNGDVSLALNQEGISVNGDNLKGLSLLASDDNDKKYKLELDKAEQKIEISDKEITKHEVYSTSYVKSFKVIKGKKSFKAKWKKQNKTNQKKFDGYQIKYSLKSNMAGAKTVYASKSASSKTVKNLKVKKKYYVRIRTYTKQNGETFYSKWKTKTVKTK